MQKTVSKNSFCRTKEKGGEAEMKKVIAKTCIKVAEYAAKKAVVKASPWNHYQNMEQDSVRHWMEKKTK